MAKLLIPVNVISLVLLSSMATLTVAKVKASVDSSLRSKAEGMLTFLGTAGQKYMTSNDVQALDEFARTVAADFDFNFVAFYDKDGHILAESTRSVNGRAMTSIERKMTDSQGKGLGRVVIAYNYDRVSGTFYDFILLAAIFTLLIQSLLSVAIWAVSRSIVKPLHESLSKLTRTTGVLADTSMDISKFSEYLSSGVNQQAEVVQETTAAMSEMSTMLNQASSYAKESETVMTAVKQKANNGMSIMNQLVDAMGSVQQVNEQLRQMVEIIREIATRTNVINDIVFKTQLLSFNASIEAARAGQHGRGFAVVAEEVGNLAKTSGSAAQQIALLLQDSERQVNEIVSNTSERMSLGKSVSEQALRNFKEIAADINLMVTHVSNITSAAREQELGVAQTTQAMSELSNATEINNGVAQRASETAKTLEEEVQILNEIANSIELSITGRKTLNRVEDAFLRSLRDSAAVSRHRQAPQSRSPQQDHDWSERGSLPSTEELGKKIVEMAKRAKEADSGTADGTAEDRSDDGTDPKFGNVG